MALGQLEGDGVEGCEGGKGAGVVGKKGGGELRPPCRGSGGPTPRWERCPSEAQGVQL